MDEMVLKPAAGFEYYKNDIYWNNFDQVTAHINEAVSGDPRMSWMRHLARRYGVREPALFISCGNGWVERDCFRAGLIRSVIGFDVSDELVATAAAKAAEIGMPARYFQADGNNLRLEDLGLQDRDPESPRIDGLGCELVVNHGAMHHIAFIDRLTRQLAGILGRGGLYVINDYTGPHRNQYAWEAVSRTIEINQSLPQEYRVRLGYAHVPTMLASDPTEAIHSELQMDVLQRYFDITTQVSYGGAIAYSLLFQNHALHRDQNTERGASWIGRILQADQEFLRERPQSNLFTFAVCTPKVEMPNQIQLNRWRTEEVEREAQAAAAGGRYYPPTALELVYNEIGVARHAAIQPSAPIGTPPEEATPNEARAMDLEAVAAALPCKLCGSAAAFFDVVDFNKCAGISNFYDRGPSGRIVRYYRCGSCGFLFTPFCDTWTGDTFRELIYNDEYVAVDPDYAGSRSQLQAERLRRHLAGFEGARILDYGAGNGSLATLMVAAGFAAVQSYDPFSQPMRPEGQFAIITCIEVIEHSPDPIGLFTDLRALLADDGCIIFSQTLQPPDIGSIRANWWYCAPRNGHVSTYTDRALARLAARFGLIFHRGAGGLHALRTLHGGATRNIADRLAPAFWAVTLAAPGGDDGDRAGGPWHAREQHGAWAFRWTAASSLTWHVQTPPGETWLVQVRIPFVVEVRPGLAGECRVAIGGKAASVAIHGGAIVAEAADVAGGAIAVTLDIPELLRPADLGRNEDRRLLGLAISVAEVPAGGETLPA